MSSPVQIEAGQGEQARGTSRAAGRLPALAPILLLGLVLLFFARMAFSNLILARGDTFLYFYPYWDAAATALRTGRVPFWNPELFMGAPLLANSQVGFFYVLNWPFWLTLDAPQAVKATIILHVFIAAVGTYLAGRRLLDLSRVAALLAATLFALGGYLTAQVEHVNQLQGLAWLPWFFVALTPALRSGASGRGFDLLASFPAASALFALQLAAGHTQTAFISGVAAGAWLLVLLFQRSQRAGALRALLVFGASAVFALALAAAQLAPTLELAGLSSRRGGLSLAEALSFSWHPLHLTRSLLPAYGQSLFTEYVAFLPLTALALAILGVRQWRKPFVLAFAVLALLGLLLALGRFNPAYWLLARLPGFDLFRAPARWLALYGLGAALLAGVGWQAVADWWHNGRSAAGRRELTRPLLIAAALIAGLMAWGVLGRWLAGFIPTGPEAPFEAPSRLTWLGWAVEGVLLVALLWFIFAGRRIGRFNPVYGLPLLCLAALWLGSRTQPYNNLTTPEAYSDLRPPAARLLAFAGCAVPGRPCAQPPDRLLSLSDLFFEPGDQAEMDAIYADRLSEAARFDYTVAVKHKEVISPNLPVGYGLASVDGFDGGILPLRAYSELMRLLLPPGETTTDGRLREQLDAVPDERWLSLFNARYLITDKVGDVWRRGVFFDRQHPAALDAGESAAVGFVPPFEATELWLLGDAPPPVEIVTTGGRRLQPSPELLEAPDLYRLAFPEPAMLERITLLPCEGAGGCRLDGLTLVDARDGAFQSLVLGPYRLIHSGDVKLYENPGVLPRAFLIHDWRWFDDPEASLAAMGEPGFDPRRTAALIGDAGGPAPQAGERQGSATVVAYAPERVAIRTEGDGGLLALSDAYYPGWRATIDGRPTDIYQTDVLFRGVFVPEGTHEIIFSYRPTYWRPGLAISLIGLALWAAAAAALTVRWAGRRRPRPGG